MTDGARRFPDFLGIGAMRCGTTQLWDLVRRHPTVYAPEVKELHFFDDRDGNWGRGLDWYAAHFAGAPAGSVCGETTPSYMAVPEAAERIAASLPETKLVATLRDPAARAWSHYWFNVRAGRESRRFWRAIGDEERELRESPDAPPHTCSYLRIGFFEEQLRRFEGLVGRERLRVVMLDELIADRDRVLREVFEFIGVDPASPLLDDETPAMRNEGLSPRLRALHLAFRRLSRVRRAMGLQTPRPLSRLTRAARRANLRQGTPSLDAETLERLRESFVEADAALASWLGRPLPWRGASPAREGAEAGLQA